MNLADAYIIGIVVGIPLGGLLLLKLAVWAAGDTNPRHAMRAKDEA